MTPYQNMISPSGSCHTHDRTVFAQGPVASANNDFHNRREWRLRHPAHKSDLRFAFFVYCAFAVV